MAATLPRVLTVSTVLVLIAVLTVLFLRAVTGGSLDRWFVPLAVALGVLVAMRRLLNALSARSRTAGPVADAMAVQSRLYGFTPGSSRIEQHGGPPHTTSEVDPYPRHGPDLPPCWARSSDQLLDPELHPGCGGMAPEFSPLPWPPRR